MSSPILADAQVKMKKAVDYTLHEFSAIHTGKANPTMLEGVMIDAYGPRPLLELAVTVDSGGGGRGHRIVTVAAAISVRFGPCRAAPCRAVPRRATIRGSKGVEGWRVALLRCAACEPEGEPRQRNP